MLVECLVANCSKEGVRQLRRPEEEEIASKGCGKSKSNEKTQEKELGRTEREDHHRAEGTSAKTVLGDGDARPELASRWWPAHRCCASDNGGHAKQDRWSLCSPAGLL